MAFTRESGSGTGKVLCGLGILLLFYAALTMIQCTLLSALVLPAVDYPNAGAYTAQAMNSAGLAISAPATLVVGQAPVFTLTPLSRWAKLGSNVTFNSFAAGDPAIYYYWRKNSNSLPASPSASGSNLTLIAAGLADTGAYEAIAYNTFGQATTAVARLTVAAPIHLDYARAPVTNTSTTPPQILDNLHLIVSTTTPGVSNVFVLQGTDSATNADWEPFYMNTLLVSPITVTQQMNLPGRPYRFYRVQPPP